MSAVAFKIVCIPPKSTHQQNVRIFQRAGKCFIGKSTTNKAAQAESTLTALLRPHAPRTPLQGPLSLSVDWVYPYRKSEPKKNRSGYIPCDTRPDCDNISKGLQDIMTTLGYWVDDSQIARLTFSKYWGATPGIEISVGPIITPTCQPE
jgi:Holliday junction resolvase RusA-like endonuclease